MIHESVVCVFSFFTLVVRKVSKERMVKGFWFSPQISFFMVGSSVFFHLQLVVSQSLSATLPKRKYSNLTVFI